MKKVLLSICVIASMLGFQSCDNENSVNPEPSLSTATITGTVYANTDRTEAGNETVPANTRIVAKINTADLVLNRDHSKAYADKFYETTTNSEGKYSLEVEVGSKELTVTLYPQDADLSVKEYADDADFFSENPATVQTEESFYGISTSVNVYQGGSFIRNLELVNRAQ